MKRQRGFTLVEMLVVIIIIGVLAALVAPQLFQRTGQAKTAAARSQVEMLGTALEAYRLDNSYFPSSQQGLDALYRKPSSPPVPTNWRGPYVKKPVPKDPWARPYRYLSPGKSSPESYDLFSLGRDGKDGGTGEDGDVKSWETQD
ncbi:MAG: type II secretion system protein GspG [Candidatus Lindowbacteria bacterium RIFCSPLOWO2_12_FULL_62_27]|nr:MAG: type II secretion system protein GspG [Candidatus Lindowbacteria bacterium RIFCSPLOWO2_02_FULL_62_12]OGH59908.1 MAG: type II secretion system protein GspG [Candidatus Lindowbacteria bacterium RIFCSPLOWO2_12_FULL_62_27]